MLHQLLNLPVNGMLINFKTHMSTPLNFQQIDVLT